MAAEKKENEIIIDKNGIPMISLDDKIDFQPKYFRFHDLQEHKTAENRDAVMDELNNMFKTMKFDSPQFPVVREKIIIHRIPTDNVEDAMKAFEDILNSCGINLFDKRDDKNE